eukprot:6213828-Amphidinium_carterae.1
MGCPSLLLAVPLGAHGCPGGVDGVEAAKEHVCDGEYKTCVDYEEVVVGMDVCDVEYKACVDYEEAVSDKDVRDVEYKACVDYEKVVLDK